MKILQVTRQFYPTIGGIPTAVCHLSRHLQQRGHEVHVLALNRMFQDDGRQLPAEDHIDGLTIWRIPFRGSPRYAIAPHALRFVGAYDLIHLHSSDFFLDYLAATRFIHRKPLLLTTHGLFFHTEFAQTIKRLYLQTVTRWHLRQVDAITCDSQHDFDMLHGLVPTEKLSIIPNGIEYESLAALPVHGRDPDLLMSIGLLTRSKRHDRLLTAFARVVVVWPQAKLLIVGPDKGELSALQAQANDLGIAAQIELTGSVSDETLQTYLSRASIWLSASAYEGFGIALLEAMAAGVVPVTQPLPSFRQLLGNDGFFVDFDDPAQAAQTILTVMQMSETQRERVVLQNRVRASGYAWSRIARQFEALYMASWSVKGKSEC